jgi:glycosyltransferase involved in cell wall biosynthesis
MAYVTDSIRLARNKDRFDVTVVSSGGAESFLTPLFWRLFNPRSRSLVLLDVIPLKWRFPDRVFGHFLRHVSLILCIRTGDIDMMQRRFGVHPSALRFLPMPCPVLEEPDPDAPDPLGEMPPRYVYSAGSAHRNWPLLLQVLRDLPYPAIIATQSDLGDARSGDGLTLLPAQTIEAGRALLTRCTVLAMAFQDIDLACGPTILLDALALGIPVAATDTNGSRDYVLTGETGLLSDPNSPEALADNICILMEDDELRKRMGDRARAFAVTELGRPRFEERLVDALRSVST